ncbi:nicotinate (nicotinamide) nucleotide adenylyltransferase [Campylobacter sputorum]|uniref:nicotinate (nicotinamide) nucleotide adenylyltransferase n=1 Tax=Campylobacter sputorum TaxID=206 RepID=UPI000B7722CF|nr:nicotinate (nicotinamide) nucleotide adenylyltransferase [Campylobacter sputorum]ASM36404.1 nicotinate-mononucleotide adenylyltransferase [Campylobacter sputorum bv. faecalis CCUG 20703]
MNIAFFGGSFDPPHFGHDSIVKMALQTLDIDKFIIMPTFISAFKNEFNAPPKLRYEWAKKLWGNLPKVIISDFEINQNRPVPTIQSVKYMYKIYDINTFYLIVGADHLSTLEKWHHFDELCKMVTFIIASRDHIDIPNELKKFDINVNISSSQIRTNLEDDKIPEIIKDEVIKFYQGKR